MTVHLDPDALVAFGADILAAAGVPGPDALLVADSLVTDLVLALRVDAIIDLAEFDRRNGVILPGRTVDELRTLAAASGVSAELFERPQPEVQA